MFVTGDYLYALQTWWTKSALGSTLLGIQDDLLNPYSDNADFIF